MSASIERTRGEIGELLNSDENDWHRAAFESFVDDDNDVSSFGLDRVTCALAELRPEAAKRRSRMLNCGLQMPRIGGLVVSIGVDLRRDEMMLENSLSSLSGDLNDLLFLLLFDWPTKAKKFTENVANENAKEKNGKIGKKM